MVGATAAGSATPTAASTSTRPAGSGSPRSATAAARSPRPRRAQMERLEYFTSFWEFSNDRAIELAERLTRSRPRRLTHVYFTSGGSEGNEAALKMARYYAPPARRGRAHLDPRPPPGLPRRRLRLRHGDRLPGLPRGLRADAAPRQPPDAAVAVPRGALRRRGPDRLLLAELERTIEEIGADDIAAMIGEPVMGVGGMLVPPDDYWPRVAEVLRATRDPASSSTRW